MNLDDYKQKDLLGCLAGLQFLPQNADRWVRLSHLIARASQGKGEGSRQVSRSQLERICNRQIDAGVVMMEDPSEGLFTQAVAGPEGSYVVLGGPTQGPAFDLSVLMKAVVGDIGGLPPKFQRQASAALVALLRLSDRMCSRAGLSRNMTTAPSPHGNVTVPGREELSALGRACRFSLNDLRWSEGGLDLPEGFWSLVSLDASPQGRSGLNEAIDALSSRPLLRTGEEVTVLSPASFVTAAIRVVNTLARDMGCAEQLAMAIHEVPRLLSRNFFYFWDWDLIEEAPARTSVDGASVISSTRHRVGSDLFARVLILSDALAGSDYWRPDVDAEITARLGPTDLLVVAVQSMDRFSLLASNGLGDDVPFLLLSYSDLETIFESERPNQLCLFQFARHVRALRQRCRVIGASTLDEYALYLEHNHGFYLGDGPPPNSLSLMGDLGGQLRMRVHSEIDQHGVRTPDLRSVLEVRRLHSGLPHRIYGSPAIPELLVESYHVPIWVSSPVQEWERLSMDARPVRPFHHVLIEAVSFWLSELAPSLSAAIDPFGGAYRHIVVEIAFDGGDDWLAAANGELAPATEEWIRVSANSSSGRLYVSLCGQSLNEFATADNRGERTMLAALLRGFRALMPAYARHHLADAAIAEVIERHAPLGPKKMVLVTIGRNVNLLGFQAERPRMIQEAEQEWFLDEIGNHLGREFGLPAGPILDPDALKILNEGVVGYAFGQLQEAVSTLSPDGLIEWLVRRHEEVIAQIDGRRFETVPRIACYGPRMEEEIRDESKALGNTDLALRFLIEYVSATPPWGEIRISLRTFDRLLCLCSEIAFYGMESDLLRYGLGGVRFAFLESGRLGVDRSHLTRQQESFFQRVLAGEIRSFGNAFPKYWEAPGGKVEIPEFMAAAEGPVEAEFGLSLTALNGGLGVLLAIATSHEDCVASRGVDEVREELAKKLSWTPEKTDGFVGLLSLSQRPSFLNPPSPFKNFDVWPWRFNRRLSYLRRPIVKRASSSGDQLVWSARNVRRSGAYFLDLLIDGRLPANGREQARAMSEFQSRLNVSRGSALERRVPELFSGDDRFAVKRTIKRVGGEPVGAAGEIDCLILDRHTKRIFVVECKDLLFAKTPYEMRQQLDSVQNSDSAKKTAVSQAKRKAEWIRQRTRGALAELDVESHEHWMWTVHPVVMLDHSMFAALIHQFEVPVVSIEELRGFVQSFG